MSKMATWEAKGKTMGKFRVGPAECAGSVGGDMGRVLRTYEISRRRQGPTSTAFGVRFGGDEFLMNSRLGLGRPKIQKKNGRPKVRICWHFGPTLDCRRRGKGEVNLPQMLP